MTQEFRSIQIDLDVHKAIERDRLRLSETPNDILRRLLGIGRLSATLASSAPKKAWFDEGVSLPHGTKVRMTYNGRQVIGEIVDGSWIVDGRRYGSPSGAASGSALTKKGKKTRLDGWKYWEVQRPDDVGWTPLEQIRPKENISVEELLAIAERHMPVRE